MIRERLAWVFTYYVLRFTRFTFYFSLPHFLGPIIQGLAFTDLVDAGLPCDLEKMMQQLSSLLPGHPLGGELNIPNRQMRSLHPRANRIILGQPLRLGEQGVRRGNEG